MIVGCGRVGRHIAEALGTLDIPRLVVEADPERVDKLHELGVPVLYGDAGSSEILEHVGLDHARALVVTLPDDAAALAVVIDGAPARADICTSSRARRRGTARAGSSPPAPIDVVRPELEGGVEIVRRTLLELELPVREVQRYTELVRARGPDETERPSAEQARVLEDLVSASPHLEVGWLEIASGSALVGRTLAESGLRERAGVTVVAISRNGSIVSNPAAQEVIQSGDRLAVIGTPAQVGAADRLVTPGTS